jgi:cell division protein ZapB
MGMNAPDHALQIQDLAKRLDRLLEATHKLALENQQLKQQMHGLSSEQAHLQGRNDLAKHRVQAMIGRLNELERGDE